MKSFKLIIETPAGSNIKYNLKPGNEKLYMKKSLPLGMVFPYAFGIIPDTKGDDGDPLDVMIISVHRFFPGVTIEARLIGALLAEQSEKGKKIRNDRYFFIPEDDLILKHIKQIGDFGKEHTEQLEAFFVNYNKLEGRTFRPLRIVNSASAISLLKNIMKPS